MFNSKNAQQGQVLLVVILIMVVTLTIGLSVVSRTIINLRTAQEEEASQKAFSAAEAGIEKIITSNQNTPLNATLPNNARYSTSITTVSGGTFLVNNGNVIPKDDGADIWLSTYPNYASPFTGSVTIYWSSDSDICSSSPSTNTKAALEVIILSGSIPANAVARHVALDPCTTRASANNFSSAVNNGGSAGGRTFGHNYTITGISNGLLMRIIPLYASTNLAVTGSSALPSQGQIIESIGTAEESQRKIVVYKGYPKVPVEFFPFLLFSPQ